MKGDRQEIIIKKVYKKKSGKHGGAWKIALADLAMAMMAFFLLLWIISNTTPQQKEKISGYFQKPEDYVDVEAPVYKILRLDPESADNDRLLQGKDVGFVQNDELDEVFQEQERDKLKLLKHRLEHEIDKIDVLRGYKNQILIEVTDEGLRVQIFDSEKRPMFDSGSDFLKPYASQLLQQLSIPISEVDNKITISGHTDSIPYSVRENYSNWELSSDRANSARRALILGGLDDSKVIRVIGKSDTSLFDKSNPSSPINRRISIVILNKKVERIYSDYEQGGDSGSNSQDNQSISDKNNADDDSVSELQTLDQEDNISVDGNLVEEFETIDNPDTPVDEILEDDQISEIVPAPQDTVLDDDPLVIDSENTDFS